MIETPEDDYVLPRHHTATMIIRREIDDDDVIDTGKRWSDGRPHLALRLPVVIEGAPRSWLLSDHAWRSLSRSMARAGTERPEQGATLRVRRLSGYNHKYSIKYRNPPRGT